MHTPLRFPCRCLAIVAILVSPLAQAATHLVDSLAAFKARLKDAVAGDTITLKRGTYTTTGSLTIAARGTASQPITIAAEADGEVEIGGTHGFNIVEPAAHIVISGFKLTHAAGKNTIAAGTSHVRITRTTFQCKGDGPYLTVIGDDAQIDHNDFGDKKTIGSMIAVGGTGSQVARRLWIHHNYFHDFATVIGTPAEMIRFGLTALTHSVGAGLIEHNLFARCRGENDLISNRSSGNIYRYNTFIDSPTSQLTLRHGNECVVYGNIFKNTEGLRLFGDRHQVFSNYFEGNYIGINLGNGSENVEAGSTPSGHDRPDNCVIAFNTFVDNRTHYQLSRRAPEGLGATSTTFANNLLTGRGIAAKIEGPNTGAVWSGNLVSTAGGAGDFPTDGFTSDDPQLAPGADGIRRPQPGSPAIGAAKGSFPVVAFDLDGQPRPEKKSIGADEPGTEGVIARLLAASDVGPGAK
ncbi:polysaccharide lyase 6 family protein [Horticoccus sp. 23ND18S-11]|uniref:polysaccharide lyase 6 family protein n=1 Tax=Horticoccus sp. 23ND18S-11 TaxID=3391832 RepID=UPI0039C8CB26